MKTSACLRWCFTGVEEGAVRHAAHVMYQSSVRRALAATATARPGVAGLSRRRWQSVLSHIDATTGEASMVDVSHKAVTARTAVAGATVHLGEGAFAALREGSNAKGNVLATAKLAGIMAAKRTSDLIPLCHPLSLSHVGVDLVEKPDTHSLEIRASATCAGATGVEMEALTAASVAALTVYDMCKAAHKGIVITDIRLLAKSGGKSGEWRAAQT